MFKRIFLLAVLIFGMFTIAEAIIPVPNIIAHGKGQVLNKDEQNFYWISDFQPPLLINKQGVVVERLSSDLFDNHLKISQLSTGKIAVFFVDRIDILDKNLKKQKTIAIPKKIKIKIKNSTIIDRNNQIALPHSGGILKIDLNNGKTENIILEKDSKPLVSFIDNKNIITLEAGETLELFIYNQDGDIIKQQKIENQACLNNIAQTTEGLILLCIDNNKLNAILLDKNFKKETVKYDFDIKGDNKIKFILTEPKNFSLSNRFLLPSGVVTEVLENKEKFELKKIAHYDLSKLKIVNFIGSNNFDIIQDKEKGLLIAQSENNLVEIPYFSNNINYIEQNGNNIKFFYGKNMMVFNGDDFYSIEVQDEVLNTYLNIPNKTPIDRFNEIYEISSSEDTRDMIHSIIDNFLFKEQTEALGELIENILKFGITSTKLSVPINKNISFTSFGYNEKFNKSEADSSFLNTLSQLSLGKIALTSPSQNIQINHLISPIKHSLIGEKIPTYINIAIDNNNDICLLFSFNQVGCFNWSNPKNFSYIDGYYHHVFNMIDKIFAVDKENNIIIIENRQPKKIFGIEEEINFVKKQNNGYLLLTKTNNFYYFNGKNLQKFTLPKPAIDVFFDGVNWMAIDKNNIFTSNGYNKKIKDGLFITKSKDNILVVKKNGEIVLYNQHFKELTQTILTPKGIITMTNQGYFEGSFESLKYLNINLNNKILSLEKFYDVFYRPDIIKDAIKNSLNNIYEPQISLEEILKYPAPNNIDISLLKKDGDGKVKINYTITSDSGGIGDVLIYHNGKLIKNDIEYEINNNSKFLFSIPKSSRIEENENTRGLLRQSNFHLIKNNKPARTNKIYKKGDIYQNSIEIKPISGAENTISVIAYNQDNTLKSSTKSLSFFNDEKSKTSKIYILSIGVDTYKDKKITNLINAKNDARKFTEKYIGTIKSLDNVEIQPVKILLDNEATKNNILKELQYISEKSEPQDIFVWFIASHGIIDSTNTYHIINHDAKCNEIDNCLQISNTINSNDILSMSKKIPALNQILIMDTCHAGAMDSIISGLYDANISVLAKNMGLHLMASASSTEQALDGHSGKNSIFTQSMISGLSGNVQDLNADQKISFNELGDYVKIETEFQAKNQNFNQSPVIRNFGNDLIIFNIRKPKVTK